MLKKVLLKIMSLVENQIILHMQQAYMYSTSQKKRLN